MTLLEQSSVAPLLSLWHWPILISISQGKSYLVPGPRQTSVLTKSLGGLRSFVDEIRRKYDERTGNDHIIMRHDRYKRKNMKEAINDNSNHYSGILDNSNDLRWGHSSDTWKTNLVSRENATKDLLFDLFCSLLIAHFPVTASQVW